jgi:hypothetical protein
MTHYTTFIHSVQLHLVHQYTFYEYKLDLLPHWSIIAATVSCIENDVVLESIIAYFAVSQGNPNVPTQSDTSFLNC